MNDCRPQNEALSVLRALFDLVDAGVAPTLDLLERLLALGPGEALAYVTHLRRRKLVQPGVLRPTIAGLAVAMNVPETQPVPMASAGGTASRAA
jgi:hypothetical protein